MSYATRTDLENRYGAAEFAQRESILGVGAVDRALADASAEIDGYLDDRYLVPVFPVPTIINKRCCDIARYNLLGDACTEDARNRYTDAIKYLGNIVNGTISLDGVTSKVGGESTTRVEVISRPRVFGSPF
jgi:phage gp36-like protein